jgi:hypothetical protein
MFDSQSSATDRYHSETPTGSVAVLTEEAERDDLQAIQPPKQGALQVLELLLIGTILLIAGLAHGIGMFNNPFYLGDEGIYMSEAWAVVKQLRLDPYTYTYGHAPFGWLQIALWIVLVGGFHVFGTTIETGRALMLVFQIGSTYLLYRIARKISGNVMVAVIACLLFALSPYAIYIHRRVLLDNITTFWMLLSIVILLAERLTLTRVWMSAIAFAVAVLSKENAVLLLPALAYLVYYRAHKSHKGFATLGWVTITASIISMYVLLAILKGELFPPGTLLGGNAPHVSLLGSAGWQATREHDGGVFDLHSKFWHTVGLWSNAEPDLIIGGSIFAIISILMIKRHRLIGIMGLATFSLWIFLMRGSLVLDFYIAPELPFMALNIALVLGVAGNALVALVRDFQGLRFRLAFPKAIVVSLDPPIGQPSTGRKMAVGLTSVLVQIALLSCCLVGLQTEYASPVLGLQQDPLSLWKGANSVTTQKEAIQWVQTHVPTCDSIIIDPYMWTDLHDIPNKPNVEYTYAHNYWQAELDPAILTKVFHNDWHNVDYIVATPGLLFDAHYYHLKLVEDALAHSTQVASFNASDWQINVFQVHKGILKPGLGCGRATT